MAKPRVFISSTFYDLRQIRADIDQFLKGLGYEAIRNEEGSSPYGKEERLEEYCIQEVRHSDILVSIIGGRFGSESKDEASIEKYLQKGSISQRELRTAIDNQKQVYIFIDKNVSAEYQTYLLNKGNDKVNYKFVDDQRIYSFIEEIKNLGVNNNIKDFETSEDITSYLREQFAGLFQRFIDNQRRVKEINLIAELERTSKNLNQLVEFISNQNKDQQEEINQILMINHPLVNWLRVKLYIKYNFYIVGYNDLNQLMLARRFNPQGEVMDPGGEEYYTWTRNNSDGTTTYIKISKTLFDYDSQLINVLAANWKDSMAIVNHINPMPFGNDNDLPF
ncbi:DUF4062 domain-containing protein [uncultured Muribaculum sp.]|jgi:hypothetical protein|uniref:DUF4062 domain-containing protein n=1 Tax=uncultured Muribaculum sp. TaxID=1918613 RepID=UPI002731F5E7|nr:DUF4062 domain-containing protein [uncultured Muribaculum sp.]